MIREVIHKGTLLGSPISTSMSLRWDNLRGCKELAQPTVTNNPKPFHVQREGEAKTVDVTLSIQVQENEHFISRMNASVFFLHD